MKIALIQMNPSWENMLENHAHVFQLITEASRQSADIAVLPEMFSTGFSLSLQGLASANEHATHLFLSSAARDHSLNIIAGFKALDPDSKKGLNLSRIYGRRGEVIATYVKIHPFSYAGEDRAFVPGPGPIIFHIDGVASSTFICYDLRFPEDFRIVARRALLVFVLANWPESRALHWDSLLRARAIENQCYVIGVNRAGKDGNKISYAGGSAVFGPQGEKLASGGTKEEIVYAVISPSKVQKIRAQFPFLDDMTFP